MSKSLLILALVLSVGNAPKDGRPKQRQTIASVQWLAGCWARRDRSGETVERWFLPEANTMMGTSRRIRNDSLMSYEFLFLSAARGRLAYIAHLPGQLPTAFPATTVSDTLVVFENAKHDFPQEVRYRRVTADSIVASIAGPSESGRREIPMPFARTRCTSLPPG